MYNVLVPFQWPAQTGPVKDRQTSSHTAAAYPTPPSSASHSLPCLHPTFPVRHALSPACRSSFKIRPVPTSQSTLRPTTTAESKPVANHSGRNQTRGQSHRANPDLRRIRAVAIKPVPHSQWSKSHLRQITAVSLKRATNHSGRNLFCAQSQQSESNPHPITAVEATPTPNYSGRIKPPPGPAFHPPLQADL